MQIDVDCFKDDKKELLKSKLMLITQQRFRSERHNVFTEKINKIGLTSNDDKRIQPIDLIETYAYAMSKILHVRKKKNRCNNIIKQYKNV